MHVTIIVLYILKKESTINIVTWNTNHGSGDGDINGFPSVRNHAIKHFRNKNPDYFYCIQESTAKKPFESLYYSVQPGGKQTKEAAIADDAKNITTRTEPPEKDHTKCTYNDTANCRYYGVQYVTDTQHQFLLISYHAHYKKSNKKVLMKEFFTEMLQVAETHQMTVIIGGDFNYDVKEWKSEIEDMGGTRIKVADEYEVGKLREGKEVIDTFAVVYPPDGITYTRCELMGKPRPVSLREAVDDAKKMVGTDEALKNLKKRVLKDTEIENLYMKMDHDPVAITVKLKTPKTYPK